jgi:hypothetical protein
MDYILNPTNEEQIYPGSINNSIEQINETTNPEGDLNLLDNNFIFSKKDIEIQKIMDKNTKKTNELNNIISNEKENFKLPEALNNKSAISSIIDDIKKEKLGKKQKKKCGRKKLSNKVIKEHNKYSDDNIRRKCKHLVLKNTLTFINEKIFIMYGGKIGEGILKKELKIINHVQKSDASIDFNQDFLKKKLGEIFSESISGRYSNLPSIHNKRLIMSLINEKDENKKKYFTDLFNITFLECLRHFRGEIYINELGGLNCFENDKEKIKNKYPEDGNDYVETLQYYLDNFENIVKKKRSRKQNKKNENINCK